MVGGINRDGGGRGLGGTFSPQCCHWRSFLVTSCGQGRVGIVSPQVSPMLGRPQDDRRVCIILVSFQGVTLVFPIFDLRQFFSVV